MAHYDEDLVSGLRVPGNGDKSPIFALGMGPAVLCLHGFGGTPYEVAPMARALQRAGASVSAPMLAGHGLSAEVLAATPWQDWYASAESAFDYLLSATDGGKVVVVGFSMGGLLALRLARLRPANVAALVILAAPLRLRDWQVAAVRAWTHLPGFLRHGRLAMMRKRKGSDVTDEKVRDENPALVEMPLAGIADVIELGEIVRRDLSFIHAPTLVGHGELDHTVPLRDSLELAGSLGADVVQRLLLPRSGHLIAVDVEHAKLCDAVVAFVTKYGRASSYARRYLS